MGTVFDVTAVSKKLKRRIKAKRRRAGNVSLAAVTVGRDRATEVYRASQQRLAKSFDVAYHHYRLPAKASVKKTARLLSELNADANVCGIMIHKPLPAAWNEVGLFSRIAPHKDIEGVTPANLGRVVLGEPLFIPPTVRSVLAVLDQIQVDLYGRDVVLIGFSSHIGKPLSVLLADRLATVDITHIGTYQRKRLPFYVSQAHVLISCVGKPHFIRPDWIKKGAVVIDVGISARGGKIYGDVNSRKACQKASLVTPVPGGIGALTGFFLFDNLLKAAMMRSKENPSYEI